MGGKGGKKPMRVSVKAEKGQTIGEAMKETQAKHEAKGEVLDKDFTLEVDPKQPNAEAGASSDSSKGKMDDEKKEISDEKKKEMVNESKTAVVEAKQAKMDDESDGSSRSMMLPTPVGDLSSKLTQSNEFTGHAQVVPLPESGLSGISLLWGSQATQFPKLYEDVSISRIYLKVPKRTVFEIQGFDDEESFTDAKLALEFDILNAVDKYYVGFEVESNPSSDNNITMITSRKHQPQSAYEFAFRTDIPNSMRRSIYGKMAGLYTKDIETILDITEKKKRDLSVAEHDELALLDAHNVFGYDFDAAMFKTFQAGNELANYAYTSVKHYEPFLANYVIHTASGVVRYLHENKTDPRIVRMHYNPWPGSYWMFMLDNFYHMKELHTSLAREWVSRNAAMKWGGNIVSTFRDLSISAARFGAYDDSAGNIKLMDAVELFEALLTAIVCGGTLEIFIEIPMVERDPVLIQACLALKILVPLQYLSPYTVRRVDNYLFKFWLPGYIKWKTRTTRNDTTTSVTSRHRTKMTVTRATGETDPEGNPVVVTRNIFQTNHIGVDSGVQSMLDAMSRVSVVDDGMNWMTWFWDNGGLDHFDNAIGTKLMNFLKTNKQTGGGWAGYSAKPTYVDWNSTEVYNDFIMSNTLRHTANNFLGLDMNSLFTRRSGARQLGYVRYVPYAGRIDYNGDIPTEQFQLFNDAILSGRLHFNLRDAGGAETDAVMRSVDRLRELETKIGHFRVMVDRIQENASMSSIFRPGYPLARYRDYMALNNVNTDIREIKHRWNLAPGAAISFARYASPSEMNLPQPDKSLLEKGMSLDVNMSFFKAVWLYVNENWNRTVNIKYSKSRRVKMTFDLAKKIGVNHPMVTSISAMMLNIDVEFMRVAQFPSVYEPPRLHSHFDTPFKLLTKIARQTKHTFEWKIEAVRTWMGKVKNKLGKLAFGYVDRVFYVPWGLGVNSHITSEGTQLGLQRWYLITKRPEGVELDIKQVWSKLNKNELSSEFEKVYFSLCQGKPKGITFSIPAKVDIVEMNNSTIIDQNQVFIDYTTLDSGGLVKWRHVQLFIQETYDYFDKEDVFQSRLNHPHYFVEEMPLVYTGVLSDGDAIGRISSFHDGIIMRKDPARLHSLSQWKFGTSGVASTSTK